MITLYFGNKNYSSWSMRPWVLLRQAGIAFEEVMVRFDSFDADSSFKQLIDSVSPVGKVPALVDDGFVVWDTLAIAEYLAEKYPEKNLWPQDIKARARARSVCAEMHSGFSALRSACPMNIEAHLPETGQLIWRDKPAVRRDVARIVAMWSELLSQHKGPMLFGEFSTADAFFAPVCMRLKTYALPVPANITAYIERLSALPGVKAWIDGALAEKDFRDFEEPYRVFGVSAEIAEPSARPEAAGVTPQRDGRTTPANPPPLAPPHKPATFVLIHGAWHGGWCYQRVAELLRAQGHRVYAPSLTGLADRSHLLSPTVGLKTHVDDVVNLVKWEDLSEVVLCGHSYGGMVITGAVERLEGRIKSLVYLDALVPDAGKSVLDYATPASQMRYDALALAAGGGYIAPISAAAFSVNEKDQAWVDTQCTPQPYQTFRDSLPAVTVRDRIARKYYVLAEKYASETMAGFAASRRSLPDWTVIDLPYGHDLMVDAPEHVVDILLQAAA